MKIRYWYYYDNHKKVAGLYIKLHSLLQSYLYQNIAKDLGWSNTL